MLSAMHCEKYADVLVLALKTSRRHKFAHGDVVLVRFDAPALPLVEAVHKRLLEEGLNPVIRMHSTSGMERSFYDLASMGQLNFVEPGEAELRYRLAGRIVILAPQELDHLRMVHPDDLTARRMAFAPLHDILEKREDLGEFGWTICIYPTPALAEAAGLTPEDYARKLSQACLLTRAQPTDDWKLVAKQMGEVRDWLNGLDIHTLELESATCRLRLNLGERRRWIGFTGHNVPSSEIYISPDWRSVEGAFTADLPSIKDGTRIEGVRLEFVKGMLVKLEADSGVEAALRQTALDPGARRLGEFSLTDTRFSTVDTYMAHTLFDENFGGANGNCHIALGASYSESFAGDPVFLRNDGKRELGFNVSGQHWDLVNTEPRRVVAGLRTGQRVTIYEDGRFRF